MVLGERWVQKRHFDGLPKLDDLEILKEELGDLKDGEIIFRAEFLSVDPYQRAHRLPEGTKFPITMMGSVVAKVIESKSPDYPVGCRIITYAGWVKVGKIATKGGPDMLPLMKAIDIGSLSPSLLLGACGMPGNTAYFGFLEICEPKAGETVVVNGAAGAVGSLVGQIAKIKGCRVIGYAGTDDKVKWLKELGFDEAFNYKKTTASDSLTKAAPNGVDCFFDNVGGEDSTTVMFNMNHRGRISVCGAISTYNDKTPVKATTVQRPLIFKELKMEGFMVYRWLNRWNEGLEQMAKWIQDGKIKVKETVIDGFENAPRAFLGLFEGANTGKMVVKI